MDLAGDIDRLSALPDDLLHAILAGVGEATAVIRTAVLSKRWRRVWIHAQGLDLQDAKVMRPDSFAGFVDWVLACRGDADIGSLEIRMFEDNGVSPERFNQWLRYAMRHVVKSFNLELPLRIFIPSRWLRPLSGLPLHDADEPAVVLPSHGRMASLTMYLSDHVFHLPVAVDAKYEALTELVLSSPSFSEKQAPGGGRTLGDFVSSCCPRLRKLGISFTTGLPQLVIRSETLQELKLTRARDLRVLDVTAHSLRVVEIESCFGDMLGLFESIDHVIISKTMARIVAPRLEEIAIEGCWDLDIRDMASVRRLRQLHLYMHGPCCSNKDGNLWLLENCPGVEHLGVSLVHGRDGNGIGADSGVIDLTADGAAPFANVRSIVVNSHLFSGDHHVSSIWSLLSRCPHVRSLSVHVDQALQGYSGTKCYCDGVHTWKFHQKFFLGSLEEVTIDGFLGAVEDMDLLTSLFQSSSSIRRVTIDGFLGAVEDMDLLTSLFQSSSLKRLMDGQDGDDEYETETTHKRLMNIPCTDVGCWHFGEDIYTWTCYATQVHGDANSALN